MRNYRPRTAIDVTLDFTRDPLGSNYKNNSNDPISYYDKIKYSDLGVSEIDPDRKSKSLQLYQRQLYDKKFPNGDNFDLELSEKEGQLTYDEKYFSSDSIISSFRYRRYCVMNIVSQRPDWKDWVDKFTHKAYTIGGEMLFPVEGSINSVRGFRNPTVSDRWDLTMLCFQSFYDKETDMGNDGLNKVLNSIITNKWFYEKFIDLEHFAKFFYLDPCLNDNGRVDVWLPYYGLPRTVNDYYIYFDKQMAFLDKRIELIKTDCKERGIPKM